MSKEFPGLTPKYFTLYACSKEQGINVNGHEWFCPVIEKPDKKMSILYRNGIFVFEFPNKEGCQTYDDTIQNYGHEVLHNAVHDALQAVVDQIPEPYFTGDEIVSGYCYPNGKVICTTKKDFITKSEGDNNGT